ncbi:hypothetical protein AB1Y20_016029 [Prymnesium parvum]|uniref:Non-specific serine/threonine protein kinase n=1 Tax=Prymnesium parvum TaxID=97485 RepID=A0AB34K075_PRYPA
MFVVGANVGTSAVLEVSTRLLHEGTARIGYDVDSALVALRQSFALECQYSKDDPDGSRVCRACASYCRALAKASNGEAPASAVPVLIQALDVLRERRAAGIPAPAAESFIVRELLGLSNHLSGATATSPRHSRGEGFPTSVGLHTHMIQVDQLRAADRALERLVEMASAQPIQLESPSGDPHPGELVLTQQELLFKQARVAQRIGQALAEGSSQRERDAATFYLHRAVRKLRLAGLTERDAPLQELLQCIATIKDMATTPRSECMSPTSQKCAARAAATEESCTIC